MLDGIPCCYIHHDMHASYLYLQKYHYICALHQFLAMTKPLNRLKVVLAEKQKTNKWLAEQLGKDQTTISKWCTNSSQPDLGSLLKIADLLEVDLRELIVREYKSYLLLQENNK